MYSKYGYSNKNTVFCDKSHRAFTKWPKRFFRFSDAFPNPCPPPCFLRGLVAFNISMALKFPVRRQEIKKYLLRSKVKKGRRNGEKC